MPVRAILANRNTENDFGTNKQKIQRIGSDTGVVIEDEAGNDALSVSSAGVTPHHPLVGYPGTTERVGHRLEMHSEKLATALRGARVRFGKMAADATKDEQVAINIVGDSVTLGSAAGDTNSSSSTVWKSESYVPLLRKILSRSAPIAAEGWIPAADIRHLYYGSPHPNWGVTGGPAGSARRALTAGQYMTLTIDAAAVDLVFSGDQTFEATYSVDGGSAITITNTAGAAGSVKVVSVDLTEGQESVVTVTHVSGTILYWGAVARPRVGKGGLVVNRMGVGGSKVGDWNGADGRALFTDSTLWPTIGLTIINLTVNDFNAQTTIGDTATAGTYKYNLDQLIQAARAVSAGVIVVAAHPRDAALAIPQADYNTAAEEVSAQYGDVAFVSLYDLMDGDFTFWNTAGFYHDTVHPTTKGHAFIARSLAEVVRPLLETTTGVSDASPPTEPLRAFLPRLAGTAAAPGENVVVFQRVFSEDTRTITRLRINVAVASGAVYVAVYDKDFARQGFGYAGTMIAGIMELTPSSGIALSRGTYYLAVCCSSATAELYGLPDASQWGDGDVLVKQETAHQVKSTYKNDRPTAGTVQPIIAAD